MTAPTFDGAFAHNWTAEILPNRPMILPARHYVYPALVDEVELGALEVLIQSGNPPPKVEGYSLNLQPFLATCALGFRDPAVPTGLWSTPKPEEICAVSGGYAYLIDTTAPESFTMIPYRPVLAVRAVSDHGLLLFVGHHTLLAWSAAGRAWESGKLSDEGVTITRIEGEVLHGLGWEMMSDRETSFAVHLRTGRFVA
jgi:hypothetical protein